MLVFFLLVVLVLWLWSVLGYLLLVGVVLRLSSKPTIILLNAALSSHPGADLG